MEAGEEQWRVVRSEKWRRFSEEVDNIVESAGGKRRHEEEQEEFETVHMTCSYCTLTFNTRYVCFSQLFFPNTTIIFSRVAYLDHQKVHQPELARFTCEKCREMFVVESVYLAHLRGHRAPYSSTKLGSFRCNGCCQYFRNRAGNKPSRSLTFHNHTIKRDSTVGSKTLKKPPTPRVIVSY